MPSSLVPGQIALRTLFVAYITRLCLMYHYGDRGLELCVVDVSRERTKVDEMDEGGRDGRDGRRWTKVDEIDEGGRDGRDHLAGRVQVG